MWVEGLGTTGAAVQVAPLGAAVEPPIGLPAVTPVPVPSQEALALPPGAAADPGQCVPVSSPDAEIGFVPDSAEYLDATRLRE